MLETDDRQTSSANIKNISNLNFHAQLYCTGTVLMHIYSSTCTKLLCFILVPVANISHNHLYHITQENVHAV